MAQSAKGERRRQEVLGCITELLRCIEDRKWAGSPQVASRHFNCGNISQSGVHVGIKPAGHMD